MTGHKKYGMDMDEPADADRILRFLVATPEQTFTAPEIHDAVAVERETVDRVLARLEERGLVDHRGEAWSVADADAAATTLHAASIGRSRAERYGPESPTEWGPGHEENPSDSSK